MLWDRGRVNDGDTACPVGLLAEGSRLKKEVPEGVTSMSDIMWRNKVPNEKWGHAQSWRWISSGGPLV